jgi:hypothetical protein
MLLPGYLGNRSVCHSLKQACFFSRPGDLESIFDNGSMMTKTGCDLFESSTSIASTPRPRHVYLCSVFILEDQVAIST